MPQQPASHSEAFSAMAVVMQAHLPKALPGVGLSHYKLSTLQLRKRVWRYIPENDRLGFYRLAQLGQSLGFIVGKPRGHMRVAYNKHLIRSESCILQDYVLQAFRRCVSSLNNTGAAPSF
jgi:hypothetical protein